MAKLTLSVDPAVVARAKQYAKQGGVSVSAIVEAYLASISAVPATKEPSPILHSLRGTLKKADPQEYKRHLARKYR